MFDKKTREKGYCRIAGLLHKNNLLFTTCMCTCITGPKTHTLLTVWIHVQNIAHTHAHALFYCTQLLFALVLQQQKPNHFNLVATRAKYCTCYTCRNSTIIAQ